MKTFLLLMFASSAMAGTVYPIGPFPGNDNAELVSFAVGQPVELVGKWDDITPLTTWTEQGLATTLDFNLLSNSHGEAETGGYDYLVAKGGPQFLIFLPGEFWTDGRDISHVSLYRIVPEPTGFVLILSGIALIRRKRRGTV